MSNLLTRDYYKDTINLSDISVHNGIEHDASLTRALVECSFSYPMMVNVFTYRPRPRSPARSI